MRDKTKKVLGRYIKNGKAFEYIVDAVELYNSDGDSLKRIYKIIAEKYSVKPAAVDRSIALAVSGSEADFEEITPKEFIARIKEQILFEFDE